MTTIDRLGIRGIRSYGTDEETFIKFFKPLTIILGRNGSGKSTIIEAVKMATTGDLPPNVDKGAAFIHDPRIDNETETKAKIRLMFSNIRGDQYIVSRHFQLLIKTGAKGVGQRTEFKTLDSTLKRSGPDGSAISSYRCADLNTMLPEVMRVTKPVLNNVIFVHQEDSLWPLGDPKKLKEKFDEIFAATRYTKALDTIRKYRRDQAAELKTVNVELEMHKGKVELLEKVRTEVDETYVRYERLRKGLEQLSSEMKDKKNELQAARDLTVQWQEKRNELKQLEAARFRIDADLKERYSSMQIHLQHESDEDISTELDELKKLLDSTDNERAKRAKDIQLLNEEIDMKREEFSRRQERKGKLEEQAKQHDQRVQRLDEMKQKFAKKDSVFGTRLTEVGKALVIPTLSSSYEAWTAAFAGMLQDAEKNVASVTSSTDKALKDANLSVSNARLKYETCREDQRRKSKELEAKRNELANIRRELRNVDSSQASITEAESKLRAAENLWKEKSSSDTVKKHEESIAKSRRKRSELQEDLESNRRTREQLVQDQNEQARLEFSKETARNKKRHVDSLMDDFHDLLTLSSQTLLSKDDDADGVDGDDGSSDLQSLQQQLDQVMSNNESTTDSKREHLLDASSRILAKRDTLLQAAENRVHDAKASLSSLSAQYQDLKKDVDKAKRELRRTETELSGMMGELTETNAEISDISSDEQGEALKSGLKVDELIEMFQGVAISNSSTSGTILKKEHVDATQDCVGRAETAVNDATVNISMMETGVFLAESDLETFEKDSHHKCPACGLTSSKRIEYMRKNLEKRVNHFKNPANLQAAQQRRKVAQSTASITRKLHLHCTNALSAIDKFSSLSQRLTEVKNGMEKAKQEQKTASATLSNLQSSVGAGSRVEDILARKLELKQGLADLEKAERDASQLQESVTAGTGATMTLAEVDVRVRKLEEEIQALQDKMDKEGRALEREREDLRRTENRLHVARNHCLELEKSAEKFKRLQREKEDSVQTIASTEKEVEKLRVDEASFRSQLEDTEMSCEMVRVENNQQLQQAGTILSNRKVEVQRWKECCREVEGYLGSRKKADLDGVIKSLEAMDEDIKSKTADLRGQEQDLQTAADSQKEMHSRITNLRDNQRYRNQKRTQKINEENSRSARAEISALAEKCPGGSPPAHVEKMSGELDSIHSQFHATKGQRHVVKETLEKSKLELEKCEKEGSRKKFDESRIKKQTMELASQDLERYYRALDQSLMAFHTLKMRSINRTIKELWQQTYRGTDIDEIEITSDHNTASESGGTSMARRNFNYRVVMRRGQAALDMRGRCSAGQKVLACLVVRLALAESFCSDCGILALDEPTTNLDRMNIESLASALRAIIETRRRQTNFQLVLITHDEEFIELLGARDFCSEYFKIFKNERQISCAKIESLLEVGT